jgi:hypothetical protein
MITVGRIWYVHGDPDKVFFATKLDAEKWARLAFPGETQERRYSRVRYHSVESFEPGLQLLRS